MGIETPLLPIHQARGRAKSTPSALTLPLRNGMLRGFAASTGAHQEHMSPATAFDDRVVVSIAKRRHFDPRTLSALLKARELLALSLGLLLAKVRETGDLIQAPLPEEQMR